MDNNQASHAGKPPANLIHDLRGPVASARLTIRRLINSPSTPGDDDLHESLRRVDRHLTGVLRHMEAALEESRLDADQLRLRRQVLGLRTLCVQAVDQVREAARLRGLGLHLQVSAVLAWRVDGPLFVRALANVLDNAMARAEPGDVLQLSASGRRLRIGVRAGVVGRWPAPAAASAATSTATSTATPASASASADTRRHSHGRGLAQSQRIIEAHGGRLDVQAQGPGVWAVEIVQGAVGLDVLMMSPDPGLEATAREALTGSRAGPVSLMRVPRHERFMLALDHFFARSPSLVVLDGRQDPQAAWSLAGELRAHALGRDLTLWLLAGPGGQAEQRELAVQVMASPADFAQALQAYATQAAQGVVVAREPSDALAGAQGCPHSGAEASDPAAEPVQDAPVQRSRPPRS